MPGDDHSPGNDRAARHLTGRRAGSAVAVVALLLAVGCRHASPSAAGSPAPVVIRLGTAHPSGHKTTVAQPNNCADECAYTDPSSWPSACDLLDHDEIRAVFPEATSVETTARDQKITTKEKNGLRATLGVAKGSICDFGTHQPSGYVAFQVTVNAVGRADSVKADYDENRKVTVLGGFSTDSVRWTVADRADLGPTGCFTQLPPAASASVPPSPAGATWDLTGDEITCYHGGFEFRVAGPWWNTIAPPVIFAREGKTTTFTDRAGALTYVIGTATAELARTIDATLQ